MEKEIVILDNISKEERYIQIIPLIEAYISSSEDIISILANVAAVLKEGMGYFWVGFYLKKNSELLYLGPFQGPPACTQIKYGNGVCGMAWKEGKTIIVPDVDNFPGHIACSSLSRSEIVVPIIVYNDSDDSTETTEYTKSAKSTDLIAVLDIDSNKLADFDDIDRKYLEMVVKLICKTVK